MSKNRLLCWEWLQVPVITGMLWVYAEGLTTIYQKFVPVLASMGFKQNDIGKSLSVLNWRIMKLLLAKMLMGRYNILIMDEQ